MSDIALAWAAVTDWLAVHAPASHATLRPGATMAEVRTAEDELGVRLPADLVALLTVCDGTVDASAHDRDPDERHPGLLLAERHLLPLREISTVREARGTADQYWEEWIPFAVDDYSLAPWSGLAIDARGRLAAFSQAAGEPPEPLASPGYGSLGEFLGALAEAFTRGAGPPAVHTGSLRGASAPRVPDRQPAEPDRPEDPDPRPAGA
ncbi:SMI1/KNR4 family protein [Streptomyces sp. NPDC020141]|uniref:SMI1/KNR4 family protein n=1 Tax=Streptomyces sp. NPDC020141 TaxID=3365065 RepID=UPI0037ABF0B3